LEGILKSLRLKDSVTFNTSLQNHAVNTSSQNHSAAMTSAMSFGDANSGFQAGIINGQVNTTFHHYTAPGKLHRAQADRR
jgi:hypothetical protein